MAQIRKNPTLSDDLISEILLRVPVKSLLRFQSVCKAWFSLIKDPAFVNSQNLRSITTETDQTLIVSRFRCYEKTKFSLLHVDSRKIMADLNFQYSRGALRFRIVGSADGIVCVNVTNLDNLKTSLCLWNPAIRRSKLILSYSVSVEEALGFGYDAVNHDFKVVRVVRFESPRSLCVEVYSDNRDEWRKVPDQIDIPCSGDFHVRVGGFLCSIGEQGMMAFDLNKEVLNCAMKLPIVISDNDGARVIEFKNSVAVIIMVDQLNYVNRDWRLDEKINMWTLNDEACLRGGGVEASWTPMFSIDIFTAANPDMAATIIHGYFRERDLLLLIINEMNDYAWISCDFDKKEVKIVPFLVDMDDHYYFREMYKYTESLVSLQGFKQVNWNADNN